MSLEPSFGGLVENYRAGLNESLNVAFRFVSICSQIHTDTATDGITLRFSRGAVLDDRDGLTKGKHVVDTSPNPDVIELWLVFPFRPFSVNSFSGFTFRVYRSLKTHYSLCFSYEVHQGSVFACTTRAMFSEAGRYSLPNAKRTGISRSRK